MKNLYLFFRSFLFMKSLCSVLCLQTGMFYVLNKYNKEGRISSRYQWREKKKEKYHWLAWHSRVFLLVNLEISRIFKDIYLFWRNITDLHKMLRISFMTSALNLECWQLLHFFRLKLKNIKIYAQTHIESIFFRTTSILFTALQSFKLYVTKKLLW